MLRGEQTQARLQLVLGDMFDGSSDLIVVPCSTAGTVTKFVRERLRAFDLPSPRRGMKLGDIEVQRFEKPLQQVASFVAFAASVHGFSSDLQAIHRIGRQLGEFATDTPSVLQVSAPLLGAGAGHLQSEDVVKHLARGFVETGPKHATLKIFVLHQSVYDRLHGVLSTTSEKSIVYWRDRSELEEDTALVPRIRVFISYTRTTDAHSSWVKNLATFLRKSGIDSRLDQWHLSPGNDVAQWMCNEIEIADRVLVICNEEYARRADGRHGGVGWETRLIQGYLLQEGENNPEKFIPIVRTPKYQDGLPAFLRTSYCLHWPDGNDNDVEVHDQLLKILYKVQEEAPAIGRPPSFIIDALRKMAGNRATHDT